MMEPKHRIKSSIIKLGHMSRISTNLTVNGIMDVFKTGIGTWFIDLPHMVTECCKILVVRIIHQNVDGALKTRELRSHGIEYLAFF